MVSVDVTTAPTVTLLARELQMDSVSMDLLLWRLITYS